MGDFLPQELLSNIKSHFEEVYPKEGCGVLTLEGEYLPILNTSDEGFTMDKKEFMSLVLNGVNIVAVVHSHPDEKNPIASKHDKLASRFLNIPYIIMGIPSGRIIEC